MFKIFNREETKTLTSDVKTYVVRWNCAVGRWSHPDIKETAQFFTSRDEAEEFACMLRDANKLLRNTADSLVKVICEEVETIGL